MNKAERLWNLRDGVLAWLYELRVDGRTITQAEPGDFMAATAWSDTEVNRDELRDTVAWLKSEGYVDGHGTWQGPLLRPHLTTYGEKYAASGKSVHDLPGVAEVMHGLAHRGQQWRRRRVPQSWRDADRECPAEGRAGTGSRRDD